MREGRKGSERERGKGERVIETKERRERENRKSSERKRVRENGRKS